MILSSAEFNAHLRHMGQDVLWRRAYACPCVNPRSGAAVLDCPHCFGKGRLWDAPEDSRIGVSGRDVQRTWATFGQYEAGDEVVIIGSDQAAYAIGPYDRIVSLNRTEPFSVNLTRGVNETVQFAVASVDRVMHFVDGSLATLIEDDLPTVDGDGVVNWGGGGPPAATTYSITGRRMAEFFVFRDMPFDRPHHAGEPLPRRVVLRRFDLFNR